MTTAIYYVYKELLKRKIHLKNLHGNKVLIFDDGLIYFIRNKCFYDELYNAYGIFE